jgi:tetratricopeptide (TPR) repeat protein
VSRIADAAELKLGTLVNARYRLDAELGQGGMGVVYRAHDKLLERDVALKILSKAGLGTEGRARLLHEARAAARLNHPNIVGVYDAGEAERLPFIVMELVEGQSLYDRMPETLDETIAIARQICTALDHAHASGVVHRDLKPENVLITPDGAVKLTDFGLARSVASRLTTEGTISGTVFYIAPEVALGQPIDGRADLYALGVILYELTTDCLPFGGDDPLAVISQHLYAPVVPPHAHRPDIPPALDALIVRLLSKQPRDRPASAIEVAQALMDLEAAPVPAERLDLLDRIVRGRLVGRERELAEVIALWRRVASGSTEGGLLLVSGEPGIGKTRLVRELVAHVAVSRGQVLMGECYAEGSMPFAPFAQMIQEAFADASAVDLDLPTFVLEDLITIAPALRTVYPDLPLNPLLDPQAERQRAFESVVTWCTALAARAPLLLFVDDAHWAGSDTLYLLRHLARRTRNLRLLIVMTYREIELQDASPLQALLLDLNRERLLARVKLTRLDREQTREMLVAILAPRGEVAQSLADAVYRETEGNPFFIEEVCKALVEEEKLRYQDGHWVAPDLGAMEIPQSVRVTVQSRLARLPAQTQDVLRIAAILGREFDFDTLQQASELDEDTLIDALEGAERAQVIEVRRSGALTPAFAFAHSIFPATLREGISVLRRQRLHRRAAAAIEAAHPDDFEALAYHYEHGGDVECARIYYTRAADRALAVYANQEAERYYRAALELTDAGLERARLLSGLGEVLFRQARYERAGQIWCDAIDLYRASGDHDNLAWLYARAARAAWYAGDPPRGLALCREGLAAIPDGLETPGVAALVHETARACFFNELPDEALILGQQALELSQRLGLVEVQADTLATLGLLPNQPFEAKRQVLTQAVELAESAGLLATASRAHLNLGGRLQEAGQLESARQHFLRARELAQQMGIAAWEHDYLAAVVDVSLSSGDFAVVEEALVTLRRLEEAIPNPERAAFYTLTLEAELTRRRGEWEAAISLLQRSQAKARQQDNPKFLISTNVALADTYLGLDRLAEAGQALTDALQALRDQPDGESVALVGLLSVLRARQGRLEEAHRLLAQARDHLGPEPNPGDQAAVSWAEAHLAAAESRWPAALAAFADAAERITQAGDRWYRARVLADWAAAHLARGEPGDRDRAQELLDEALQIFQDLQVPRYVALIQDRLPA